MKSYLWSENQITVRVSKVRVKPRVRFRYLIVDHHKIRVRARVG